MRYRCPACHKNEGLWESVDVEAWWPIDETLDPDTEELTVEKHGALGEHIGGCACGWEGKLDKLERVGIDGEPLPVVHPEQQQIEA